MLIERYGLIVGVNQYQDPNIAPLQYAEKDALDVHSFLTTQGGFAKENIALLIGREGTLQNLRKALGSFLCPRVKKEDFVFLYFAGYGGAEKDWLGTQADGWRKYFLPQDVTYDEYFSSALDIEDLAKYIKSLASREIHLFLDCSFKGGAASRSITTSGQGEKDTFGDAFVEPLLSGMGRNVYMASPPNGGAFESPKLHQGLFTHCLLEGLKGKAKREADGITPEDLAEYLRLKIRPLARQEGFKQSVYLRGDPTRKFKILPLHQEKAPQIHWEKPRFLDREHSFSITHSPFYLGSSPECDLQIPKAPSQYGLVFSSGKREWKILALSSEKLMINGKKVVEKQLFARDEIQIGDKVLVFLDSLYFSSLDYREDLLSRERVLSELQITNKELDEIVEHGGISPLVRDGRKLFDPQELADLKLSRAVQPTMELAAIVDELRNTKLLKTLAPQETFPEKKEEGPFGACWKENLPGGKSADILQPKGAITARAIAFFESRLNQSGPLLVLDLSSVLWINPRGMEVLDEAAQKKATSGEKLILVGLKDRIAPHLLKRESLADLERYSSLDEARGKL